MVLFVIVSAASLLLMPAPSALLASAESPEVLPMRLSLTVVFARVTVPQLSMPPPTAKANAHVPPQDPVLLGATRLSVMTLFVIVTVAPPLNSALGGISMPPPAANTPSWPVNGIDSGLERVTPPVIVTPSIETVGSLEAPKVPIVRTGPPPLMIVWAEPAPASLTLLSIVKPPSYVPAAIAIVSPLCAAASAGAIWLNAQPLGQTVRVAADA